MVDSGRKTSFKRKELGGSVVGSLLVKSFKTPNQILKDALNEYDGKEAVNDIANEPKVIAGRELEPVILNSVVPSEPVKASQRIVLLPPCKFLCELQLELLDVVASVPLKNSESLD